MDIGVLNFDFGGLSTRLAMAGQRWLAYLAPSKVRKQASALEAVQRNERLLMGWTGCSPRLG